jgi:hypothetical protein
MTDRPFGPPPRTSNLKALLRLARGDRSGMQLFAATNSAFIASLIPLAALPLAVALATLAKGEILHAMTDLAAALCVLLLPPVVSHALARRWGRDDAWARYAVAFNWSQFALSAVFMVLLTFVGLLLRAGGPAPVADGAATVLVLLCLIPVGYGLWLQWFLARVGLDVSKGRAAFLVLTTCLSTLAVVFVHAAFMADNG